MQVIQYEKQSSLSKILVLNQIQMEHGRTKDKFSFKCERWLSKSEDDHQIIRELPAVGKGVDPLPGKVFMTCSKFVCS